MSNMRQSTSGKANVKAAKKQPPKKVSTRSKTPVDTKPQKTTKVKPTTSSSTVEVPLTNGTDPSKRKQSADLQKEVKKSRKGSKKVKAESSYTDAPEQTTSKEPSKKTVKTTVKRSAADDDSVPEKKAKITKEAVTAALKTVVKRRKAFLDVPKLPSVSGVLLVVGENDCGQLGLGSEIAQKKRAFELDFPFRVADVAAGGMHSVCLTDRGEVYTFGCNDEGALGRVTEEDESECRPGRVEVPGIVVRISAGDSHSAALTEDGKVYIWGNFRSQEGSMGLIVPGVKSITPIHILKDIKVVGIASGNDHLVCLSEGGVAYTCGCGDVGQLGRLSERSSKGGGRKGLAELLQPDVMPLKVGKNNIGIENVWSGSYSTFVKAKSSGAIYACGLNNFSQLGFKGEKGVLVSFRPKCINSFAPELGWKKISGGQHHTLALDTNGKVYSLGNKHYGRLGLGEDCDDATVPTLVPALQNEECSDISSGNMCSFSVSSTGKGYSWGMGNSYQLGHGNDDDGHVPIVIGGTLLESWNVFRIDGGGQHTLILANRKNN